MDSSQAWKEMSCELNCNYYVYMYISVFHTLTTVLANYIIIPTFIILLHNSLPCSNGGDTGEDIVTSGWNTKNS